MQHLSVAISTIEELERFLKDEKTQAAEAYAQSILVQVYVSGCDTDWIRLLTDTIKRFSRKAVIAGATTDGEISAGRSFVGSTVVSLTFFKESTLFPITHPIKPGNEKNAAKKLSHTLQRFTSPIKGLLLLSTTFSVDCTVLLHEIYKSSPGLPLFGGGAADYTHVGRTFVFSDDHILDAGLVAIALFGNTLELSRRTYLGWKPIGKIMTVTKSSGFTIHEIDGKPAFEVYKKYLGIKADENFCNNALEFPFILKRQDNFLARVPVSVLDDGSVQFIADIREGEKLQLGYGNVNLIIEEAHHLQKKISYFSPQAIFVYSCSIRRFLMQEDVELELLPLQKIASSAGFFTHGEFCDLGKQSPLMNSTIVIVALREGEAKLQNVSYEKQGKEIEVPEDDLANRKHARILGRLLYFLDSVTEELMETNADLRNKLNEIKTLRDILPICSSCKKIRDDQGYWSQLEKYMREHSNVEFSHSICPDCCKELYSEFTEHINHTCNKSKGKDALNS